MKHNRLRCKTTYKVWLEIEECNEADDTCQNVDTPGTAIAEFESFHHAKSFVQAINGLRKMLLLPRDVACDLATILDYLWEDEQKHYRDDSTTAQGQHIFESLVNIRRWLVEVESTGCESVCKS